MNEPDYYKSNGLSPIGAFKQGLISEEEMEDYFTDEEEFDLETALNNFPDKMMVPILSHFIHHNHLLIRNPEDFAIVVKCCGLINIVEGKNDD